MLQFMQLPDGKEERLPEQWLQRQAIAARVDVFKGGLNEMLLDKLNVRVKEIADKYKEPVIKESKPEPK